MVWYCLAMTFIHLVRPTSWKYWPLRLNSVGPLSFWVSKSWVKIFDLKLGSMNVGKYSAPTYAWSGTTCSLISSAPFSKEILIWSGCIKPSLIRLSSVPSAPKDIQQVYQLVWGVFCALMRSDIVMILAFLGLSWLGSRVGLDCVSTRPCWDITSAKDYHNSDKHSSRWAELLEYN